MHNINYQCMIIFSLLMEFVWNASKCLYLWHKTYSSVEDVVHLGTKSCFMHPSILHLIINTKLWSWLFLKTISTITNFISHVSGWIFCYLFKDNISQNCQYEEVLTGYATKKKKYSICQAISKNMVFILILWGLYQLWQVCNLL